MTESVSAAKRGLMKALVLYTAFRLVLVVVIAAAFYGLGRIFTDDVPLPIVFLFAIVVALPVSMVVGRKLRDRVNEHAAVIDEARKSRRDDFRRRLQGADE